MNGLVGWKAILETILFLEWSISINGNGSFETSTDFEVPSSFLSPKHSKSS